MNTTGAMSAVSTLIDTPIFNEVWAFVLATRAEIFLFCVAMAAYLLLFSNQAPKGTRARNPKAKRYRDEWEMDDGVPVKPRLREEASRNAGKKESAIEAAFEAGDYREVLRCWTALKKSDTTPCVCLAHVVEAMQRMKRDTASIVRELKSFFQRYSGECDIRLANDLLESLGRRLDSDLADRIVEMLPTIGLAPDTQTYESLLHIHFTCRDFSEVARLMAEMDVRKVPMSPRAAVIAVKTALKTGRLEEAVAHFAKLRPLWDAEKRAAAGEAPSPSTAPRHLVSQLVELACKEHQIHALLPLLQGAPITDEAVVCMLTECARKKDAKLSQEVERLARARGAPLTDAMYSLLVKSYSSESQRVQELFEEVLTMGRAISGDLLQSFVHHCGQVGNVHFADRLFEHAEPKQSTVIVSFIRFYADGGFHERACDIYERHFKPLRTASNSPYTPAAVIDQRLERSLMHSALRCGRQDLAKDILDTSPPDVVKHLLLIKNFASAGDLEGAKNVFRALVESGAELNSVVYNTVLEACVECRDLAAAEAWMQQTKEAGVADVVSYNTLIKAHLQMGSFSKARSLIVQMRQSGLQPNHVTFNELVNGMISKGTQAQRREVWEIVREMSASGVAPNQVTCSILLKNLDRHSREEDISATMDLISTLEAPMDEVLLSSVVEACVRIGKPDLLTSKLKQLQGNDAMVVNGSHTFGSLIKAYGFAKDMDAVWRCWKAMRSRHIRPTSITLGCMVEAVVNNGDPEGAYELVNEMWGDERCRDTLNSVIYCSVLKGFTREKKLNRVWSIYQEMLSRGIDLSVVTYNTVIDACARCGRMDRLPELVSDMKKHNIPCNLITYSTMLKGYCQMGDIRKGFAICDQMKQEINLKPDEIMYNSLLDGCAQMNLVDEGLALLQTMDREGVPPSNFTLSLTVKLMSRARRVDRAFSLVDEISKKHGFRPNVHVYTNLMQACVSNKQTPRAIATFEDMLRSGIRPENRTYSVLVRACLSAWESAQAISLLRSALGIRNGAHAATANSKVSPACPNLDSALLNEALQAVTDRGLAQELAVPLISDIRRFAPHARIDPAVQRKVMAAGVEQETGHRLPVHGGPPPAATGRRERERNGGGSRRQGPQTAAVH